MSLKILHTADWHIGKQLYKNDFYQEIEMFFDWLLSIIATESIDILIVSGDIFDHANPSHRARRLYYKVLRSLIETQTKVIVTGGNHDSITNLNASSDILSLLDIQVVGGLSEDLNSHFIHFEIKGEKVVFAAIPFIRESEIRQNSSSHSQSDNIEMVKQGIVDVYKKASQILHQQYPDYVKIAMGHLYLQSAKLSESERDIQIGNQAGINNSDLSNLFDYTALGHIHRPQKFDNGTIRYSGSPIPLSFSEHQDNKIVIVLEIKDNTINIEEFKVPTFRRLVRFKGTLKQIIDNISKFTNDSQLPAYAEVEVIEKEYSEVALFDAREYLSNIASEELILVREKILFESSPRSLSSFSETREISDIKPIEVFEKKLSEDPNLSVDKINWLKNKFLELAEEASI